jgi:hypothetical protein
VRHNLYKSITYKVNTGIKNSKLLVEIGLNSEKSLTEWLKVPVGVVAQIQGDKPSATAEKHDTVRSLELLRLHHERIEAWILEQAGITFDDKAAPGALRVVAG